MPKPTLKFAAKKPSLSAVKKAPQKPTSPPKSIAPVSKPSVKPLNKPTAPSSQRMELKTGVSRPVLRAFECLVHAEQALKHVEGIGIFVGEHREDMQNVQKELVEQLTRLKNLYKAYWKAVDVASEGNQNV